MWGAVLKIFKSSTFLNLTGANESEMEEKVEGENNSALPVPEIQTLEVYEGSKAKQRSSILWLTAKANNNTVPDDLKEPYYKDHEDQDQLKPVIIHALANAEYYCLALGNIYSDPNYHRLNHWGVIQALARKGVYIAEPSDVALTETVLIQTSPIRMSAHMAVIEAIMALYIKETVTTERIVQSVKRFTTFSASNELPTDTEEALVLWINKACVKIKHRIEEDMHANDPEIQKNGSYLGHVPPSIPYLQDLSDLSDGCCLATLISFYCPAALKWREIVYNNPMSMADSLYNLQLVQKFCRDHLPFNPCFLTLEDLVYQHSSVRQNILAFLADLFFLFEIKPAKCVQLPGAKDDLFQIESQTSRNGRSFMPLVIPAAGKRSCQQPVSPIPDLRSNSYSSMPDINRISPRGNQLSPQQSMKEPMFPRRQSITQPGESRTLERAKRYSFHEAPRGHFAQSGGNGRVGSAVDESEGSMRRTHSLLDIEKNGAEKPYIESRNRGREVPGRGSSAESRYLGDSGPEVFHVHRSRGIPTISSGKVPDDKERMASGHDEVDDVFIRSPRHYEEEKLLPARIQPAKEKTNHDSKLEERGEHDHRVPLPSVQSAASPRSIYTQRSSIDEGIRPRRQAGMDSEGYAGSPPHHDLVPKHSKNDAASKSRIVGDSIRYPEKYSADTGKPTGMPMVRDEGYIHYEDYPDNRELEEQLAHQGKTTVFVPSGDSKPQYIIITTGSGDKGNRFEDMDKQKDVINNTTSFAQLSKLRDHQGGGINIVYMQHDRDQGLDGSRNPLKSSFLQRKEGGDKKTTTFAVLPNTTTWQQQGAVATNTRSPGQDSGNQLSADGSTDAPLASQLHNVRLKLEEKRRRIEIEKRRMELMLNRARQKVGKAAFLQAVTKGKGSGRSTPDSGAGGDLGSPLTVTAVDSEDSVTPQEKAYTIQEIAEDLNSVQHKWLETQMSLDTLSSTDSDRPSPDMDGVTYEEYHRSLERLNTSLSDLQTDIHRLTNQQGQIQHLMQNGMASSNSHHQHQPEQQQQQRGFYMSEAVQPRQQWNAQNQMGVERDQMYGMSSQIPPNQIQSHWNQGGFPVNQDMPTGGPHQVQAGHAGPPPTAYGYVDQHGYLIHPQSREGFALHQQHGGIAMPVQNGPNQDQFQQYNQYGMPPQYGNAVSYHPPMNMGSEMYGAGGGYHNSQSQPAPFRLHVDGPPHPNMHSQQQQSRQTPPPQYQQPQSSRQTPPPQYQHSPRQTPPPHSQHHQSPGHHASPIPRPTSLPSKALPVRAPPESFMEPQAVHFIDTSASDDVLAVEGYHEPSKPTLSSLDSLSGTATYRVKDLSPTRPALLTRTFRVPKSKVVSPTSQDAKSQTPTEENAINDDAIGHPAAISREGLESDKGGFFIALDDDEQPKRPKPPLRTKKMSRSGGPRPDRGDGPASQYSSMDSESDTSATHTPTRAASVERSRVTTPKDEQPPSLLQTQEEENVTKVEVSQGAEEHLQQSVMRLHVESPAVGFVIATEEDGPEPFVEDEMARKRERILLSALRRKEQQETIRARKESEASQRREQERFKQEMSGRKKEEERARRQAIFEQYKQRKALEDQEQCEKIDMPKTSTLPKYKSRQPKPRPKSLHESALSSAEMRSSNLNLTSSGSRGSQLNLAGESGGNYRYGDGDSSLGRATPPRRAASPGQGLTYRHPLSPSSGPPSLPPGLVARRGGPISDTASDTCSTTSSTLEYTGPKLFKQPTAKSNRGIIINAINSVLAGAVNQDGKKRALEEIARSDSKHFLILFRDSGCQFRALYSYYPDREDVLKLVGTGPRQVTEQMIDRFYKYNSGGKTFNEIQTKHLTVTIDAFTIHNSLWQGKKVAIPKKEFF